MSRNSKGFVQILVVILLLVLVGGAAYYFGIQKGKFPLGRSSTPTPTESAGLLQTNTLPKQTINPMANWKTYTNSKYGYEFGYPTEWKINTTSLQTTYIETGSIYQPQTFARVSVSETGENNKSIEEMAKTWRSGTVEKILVGGEDAAKVLQNPNSEGEFLVKGGYTLSVFVKNKSNTNLLIQLETANLTTYQAIFDQILSTFKFTN